MYSRDFGTNYSSFTRLLASLIRDRWYSTGSCASERVFWNICRPRWSNLFLGWHPKGSFLNWFAFLLPCIFPRTTLKSPKGLLHRLGALQINVTFLVIVSSQFQSSLTWQKQLVLCQSAAVFGEPWCGLLWLCINFFKVLQFSVYFF